MGEWITRSRTVQFTGDPQYVDWTAFYKSLKKDHTIREAMELAYKPPTIQNRLSIASQLLKTFKSTDRRIV